MKIDIETGILDAARHVPSPNCNARPPGTQLELIIVHAISLPPGEFGGPWIDRLFTNDLPSDTHSYFDEICSLQVSSHLLIRRDGEVVQYVPFHARAWHAGDSEYRGRKECNDFAVGIELEGCDDKPYARAQYDVLAHVVWALIDAYPSLSPEHIVGHCDVAPGRKTDPGPTFDWKRFRSLLLESSP